MTINDAVAHCFGDIVFDVLPQGFVYSCTEDGFDPRGQIVWAYPEEPRNIFGTPAPLTAAAVDFLEEKGIAFTHPKELVA
jgi:hypothetical protein